MHVRHAVSRVALETLEGRRLLTSDYFALSAGAFTQDWTDTNQIVISDNWSGVPSIVGYRGDDGTPSTGTDPQTILAPLLDVVDVNANVPLGTFVSGGVSEIEVANPSVAIQGSGTADSPFLLFHLNASSVSNIRVQYLLRDLDDSTDNATQQVALQYRVGETGDFINLPAGYVADASTQGTATQTTAVDVTLPASVDGAAQLQLRVITSNAVGSDEYIGVDNINITSDVAAGPGTFILSPATASAVEQTGSLSFNVFRTGGSTGAVTVDLATANGTATAGTDYTGITQTLTFADGETAKVVTVTLLDDSTQEADETFTLNLSNPTSGATLGTPASATATIIDDDTPIPDVLINELVIDVPGSDVGYEYIELIGTPGASLEGIQFLSIEGDDLGAGLIDQAIDLDGVSLGSNGLLVIAGNGTPLTFPAGTTFVDAGTMFSLENGTNSFVLVSAPTPIPVLTDIDANNDGTAELPPGVTVVDGIAVNDGGATDLVYAPLFDLSGVPAQAVTRIVGDNRALNAAAFFGGRFADTDGPASQGYDPLASSANTPANAVITPGDVNFVGGTDTTAPTVSNFTFQFATAGQPFVVTFSEPVTVDPAAVMLFNDTAGTPVATTVSVTGSTLTVLPTLANATLANGNYTLTLTASGVADLAGNLLAGNYVTSDFFLNGDFNRDRAVNVSDLGLLAASFRGMAGFGNGDANLDGIVNVTDLGILASNFRTTLPVPTLLSASRSGVASRSVFSTRRLSDDVLAIG